MAADEADKILGGVLQDSPYVEDNLQKTEDGSTLQQQSVLFSCEEIEIHSSYLSKDDVVFTAADDKNTSGERLVKENEEKVLKKRKNKRQNQITSVCKFRRLESSSNKPPNLTVVVPPVVNIPLGYLVLNAGTVKQTTVKLAMRCGVELREYHTPICKWIPAGSSKPCDASYSTINDLVPHIWQHMRGFKSADCVCRWQGCERGPKPFQSKCRLVEHMQAHTGKDPLTCRRPNCGKVFRTHGAFETHVSQHDKYRYPCSQAGCSEVFFSLKSRKNHVRLRHLGDERDKCPLAGCGKVFTSGRVLRKHMLTHASDGGQFECPFEGCPKTFPSKKGLAVHSRLHKKEQHRLKSV